MYKNLLLAFYAAQITLLCKEANNKNLSAKRKTKADETGNYTQFCPDVMFINGRLFD